MCIETLEQHETLVSSLMDKCCWPGGGSDRQRIDTHISTVILAGDKAYKIKKPLDLGFLNFLSLDARRVACYEELRLNRRYAPDIYEKVCAIRGTPQRPSFSGEGAVIDWAVRMSRFNPDAVLSNPEITLTTALIENLGERIADFHLHAPFCKASTDFASLKVIAEPIRENFSQIRQMLPAENVQLSAIEAWSESTLKRLSPDFEQRKAHRHVRECHGDLHLGNIALIDNQPVIFDAIEFNQNFQWIDTMNDAAFLIMDLCHRDKTALASRFLDRYLQHTGDYTGLPVLKFYTVYRAMVRAKIAAIQIGQASSLTERELISNECLSYLALAARLSCSAQGALVITHGVSGSGKSFITENLTDYFLAIRLRSDVERKRLMGVQATAKATQRQAYSQDMTKQTYDRLAELARVVIHAGFVAVVDATFLKAQYRDQFYHLAQEMGVSFAIIDCDAAPEILRRRIMRRVHESSNVSDADFSVLQLQLSEQDPLTAQEKLHSIIVNSEIGLDVKCLQDIINI